MMHIDNIPIFIEIELNFGNIDGEISRSLITNFTLHFGNLMHVM